MIVFLDALGAEAERGRDIGDARRVEIRLQNMRADDVVSLGGQPARYWLFCWIAQRKDDPARICARRLCGNRHASAVSGRLDTDLVAAPVVEFFFFFLMTRRPPRSTLFPFTTPVTRNPRSTMCC